MHISVIYSNLYHDIVCNYQKVIWFDQHVEAETKWLPFLMLNFSNSVSWMKILLVWNFTEICFQGPNWQYINVSRYMIAWSGKGDKPHLNQWWPILLMHEFPNAYLTCKELLLVHCTSNFAWNTHPLNVLYNATHVFLKAYYFCQCNGVLQ